MKFYRSIVLMLILVLASTPALSAICAISCSYQSVASSLDANDESAMVHCHDDALDKDIQKSHPEHKHCQLGAGCHFTQIVFPFDTLSKYLYADLSSAAFPKFVPAGKTVDLSPPLKPPA